AVDHLAHRVGDPPGDDHGLTRQATGAAVDEGDQLEDRCAQRVRSVTRVGSDLLLRSLAQATEPRHPLRPSVTDAPRSGSDLRLLGALAATSALQVRLGPLDLALEGSDG